MQVTSGFVKRALIREEGYSVGVTAPVFIRCGCGAKLTVKDGEIPCTCGLVYDSRGWIIKADTLKGLKEAYNRLIAWAENERLWARRMADGLEADEKTNRAKNYEALAAMIDRAIQERS